MINQALHASGREAVELATSGDHPRTRCGPFLPTWESTLEQIPDLLDRLTTDAVAGRCVDISRPIPDGAALRRDGRPVTEAATERALTTPAILAQEHDLATWAERRTICAVD